MTKRKQLRPVPHETLTDAPVTSAAVTRALIHGLREHAEEFKAHHIEQTPGHHDGCETCIRIDQAIKELGASNES